jgi:hypothetical protein
MHIVPFRIYLLGPFRTYLEANRSPVDASGAGPVVRAVPGRFNLWAATPSACTLRSVPFQ